MSRQRILGSLVSAWGAVIVSQAVVTASRSVASQMGLFFGLSIFIVGLFVALRKK